MFGMRHSCGSPFPGKWAAGRGWRGHYRSGWGGRHGMGGGNMMRVGRMLAQGDLRLIALALIAEQPRHGYELIKLIEEKTSDCYSPSPGVVYPTLTFLEEAGYVTAESEGAKKRYTITEEGRAYLEENRDIADMILARLAAIGTRVARMRRRFRRDEEEDEKASVPQLVGAALENLRDAAAKRLEGQNGEAETRIVEILARAAQDVRNA